MKAFLKYLVVTTLLSVAAFAQTTIVEYSKSEPMQTYISTMQLCTSADGSFYSCPSTPTRDVAHLEKFDTLEAAMQFMADHQDYKLLHFYSALVAVDVKVEEKKTSEPQPPIEKIEKVYKFGALTKKKTDIATTGWITTNPYTWTIVK